MESFLSGIPAPLWLIFFLKVLGFVLHLVPMGLWVAAIPVALLGTVFCSPESPAGCFGKRILRQMPIFIALGINFGIVPLLFIQALYPKPFYTATVLVAWHWIAVIPLLLLGYYAVYLASFAVQVPNKKRVAIFGLVGSLCFLSIGLLMANGLTLISHPERWTAMFEKTQIAGAVTGLGNNMRDPTFPWRLLTMLGLALATTGVWALIDAFFRTDGTDEEKTAYRRWTLGFACLFTLLATVLLSCAEGAAKGLCGETAALALAADYPRFGYVPLLALVLFISVLALRFRGDFGGKGLTTCMSTYILLISLFGMIRQIGQHTQLIAIDGMVDVSENVQWSPILLFLVCFVLGLLCIAWMVRQLVIAPRENSDMPENSGIQSSQ